MSNSTQFPTVYIDPLALEKLQLYCKHAGHNEISGLGIARADEGEIVVEDVFIFEQEVTGGDTELNADALAKWDYEIRKANGDPTLYRLWWHKHPIQGWSTTDDKNIEGMNNGDWLLSIVQTPTGFLCRLDLYKPFRVTLDSLELMELTTVNHELSKQIEEEVKAKVKQKTYVQTTMPGLYKGSSWTRGKDGSWIRSDDNGQKKDIATIPSTTSPTNIADTKEHDAFFEGLADKDWESYYNWNGKETKDESIRARLWKGGY